MTTAYTAILEEKQGVTFNEFAWRCARAFGALLCLRDSGLDVPIPEKIVPDETYEQNITVLKESIRRLEQMSDDVAEVEAKKDHESWVASGDAIRATDAEKKRVHEAMLARVEAWVPPTPAHEGLKDFMRQQIADGLPAFSYEWPKRERLSGNAWRAERIGEIKRQLAAAEQDWRRACQRADEANAWLRALRSSVGPPPVPVVK